MADDRKLSSLDPHVRTMAEVLLGQATAAGIPLVVTATRRSMAEQAALYAQGRTAPGRIVTNSPPGFSYHNFGLALDVLPSELISLPDWGDGPQYRAQSMALWEKLGAIGEAIGFRWGGRFRPLIDRPHFEWSGGLTLVQLRAGHLSFASAGTMQVQNTPPGEISHAVPQEPAPS